MHLLAQPTLGADTHAIADDQHPDHQFWIDRGPPRLAVVGPKVFADAAEVNEPIDRPQQVIGRHVSLQAELVKQRRLLGLALAHHQPISRLTGMLNQDFAPTARASFSTLSANFRR